MQWLKNCGKASGALMRESGAQTACRWGWNGDFCIGNTVQTSSSYPSLEENETALLFLVEESDNSGTYYSILGNSQGKFTKQEIDGELCYTNGRDQLPVEGLRETIQQIAEDNKDTQWASDYYTDEEIKAMNDALFESGAE